MNPQLTAEPPARRALPRIPPRYLIALVTIVAASVVAGVWSYRNQVHYRHFAEHEPGMVYRSAWLQPEAFAELIDTYQIRSVVNLCRPDELPELREGEKAAVQGAGARLFTVPLSESVTVDPKEWSEHFKIMSDPDNYPMLVHCQHGVTRTAMFLAAYDAIYGDVPAQKSVEKMPRFGHGQKSNVHVRAFAKNFDEYYRTHRDQFDSQALKVLK